MEKTGGLGDPGWFFRFWCFKAGRPWCLSSGLGRNSGLSPSEIRRAACEMAEWSGSRALWLHVVGCARGVHLGTSERKHTHSPKPVSTADVRKKVWMMALGCSHTSEKHFDVFIMDIQHLKSQISRNPQHSCIQHKRYYFRMVCRQTHNIKYLVYDSFGAVCLSDLLGQMYVCFILLVVSDFLLSLFCSSKKKVSLVT